MALTLCNQSALDVTRTIRALGTNLQEADYVKLRRPFPWAGKRWSAQNFSPSLWRWPPPSPNRPLHVLVPDDRGRMRGSGICCHTVWHALPAHSICWLDEHASMVCPELLFLQMAERFSLPALVMLGYELCGHFSRDPNDPLVGPICDDLPAATSVARIEQYLLGVKRSNGIKNARNALRYVCDHAISAPEAVLATVYSLPPSEFGYGMGPVTLNERVNVDDSDVRESVRNRYPDLSFSFAPLGINYDGHDHLDLDGLVKTAWAAALAQRDSQAEALEALREKAAAVRAKVVDDNVRNRQLASRGRIVFPATKEDLYEPDHLDALTRQVLGCVREVFGIDTSEYVNMLDDTMLKRERHALIDSLLSKGVSRGSSYGSW